MLKNKEKFDLELETMGPIFFAKELATNDEWKHGIWKGESETGYEVWDLATIDPRLYIFIHIRLPRQNWDQSKVLVC